MAFNSSCLVRHVPQRLLDTVIFHTRLNLSVSVEFLVLITEDHHLFEVSNKEILACCSLHDEKGHNGSSIINGTLPLRFSCGSFD